MKSQQACPPEVKEHPALTPFSTKFSVPVFIWGMYAPMEGPRPPAWAILSPPSVLERAGSLTDHLRLGPECSSPAGRPPLINARARARATWQHMTNNATTQPSLLLTELQPTALFRPRPFASRVLQSPPPPRHPPLPSLPPLPKLQGGEKVSAPDTARARPLGMWFRATLFGGRIETAPALAAARWRGPTI